MGPMLGFLELGLIVLAWTLIWQFTIKAWTGNHPDLPAAQGLAAIAN
jgi:hypothetical protein